MDVDYTMMKLHTLVVFLARGSCGHYAPWLPLDIRAPKSSKEYSDRIGQMWYKNRDEYSAHIKQVVENSR
jgi:hypothetical protein